MEFMAFSFRSAIMTYRCVCLCSRGCSCAIFIADEEGKSKFAKDCFLDKRDRSGLILKTIISALTFVLLTFSPLVKLGKIAF